MSIFGSVRFSMWSKSNIYTILGACLKSQTCNRSILTMSFYVVEFFFLKIILFYFIFFISSNWSFLFLFLIKFLSYFFSQIYFVYGSKTYTHTQVFWVVSFGTWVFKGPFNRFVGWPCYGKMHFLLNLVEEKWIGSRGGCCLSFWYFDRNDLLPWPVLGTCLCQGRWWC